MQCVPLDVPLAEPFRIAYDTVTHARSVLVTASERHEVGFGEGAPQRAVSGEGQSDVLADVRAAAEASRGAAEALDALRTRAGRAAWQCANMDLAARQAEAPLWEHLGGRPGRVPTSITIPLVAEEAIEPLVRRRLSEGFSSFKVKAGLGLEQDLRRIAAVRDLIGKRGLRVDANQAWSRKDAASALPALRDLGVEVLEQPLPKTDMAGHAGLRGQDVPIMLDESVFDPGDAQRAVAQGACDWINIKLQKCGGLDRAVAIADVAAEADVLCMVGCMLESRIGILHGAHLFLGHANVVAADLDGAWLLASDPVVGGGRYEDGHLIVGREPGLGVRSVQA